MFNEDGHSAEKFCEYFQSDYDSPDIRKHMRLAALELLSNQAAAAADRLSAIRAAARREGLAAPRILASPVFHFLDGLIARKTGEGHRATEAEAACLKAGGSPGPCLNDLAVLLAGQLPSFQVAGLLQQAESQCDRKLPSRLNRLALMIGADAATPEARQGADELAGLLDQLPDGDEAAAETRQQLEVAAAAAIRWYGTSPDDTASRKAFPNRHDRAAG